MSLSFEWIDGISAQSQAHSGRIRAENFTLCRVNEEVAPAPPELSYWLSWDSLTRSLALCYWYKYTSSEISYSGGAQLKRL